MRLQCPFYHTNLGTMKKPPLVKVCDEFVLVFDSLCATGSNAACVQIEAPGGGCMYHNRQQLYS